MAKEKIDVLENTKPLMAVYRKSWFGFPVFLCLCEDVIQIQTTLQFVNNEKIVGYLPLEKLYYITSN